MSCRSFIGLLVAAIVVPASVAAQSAPSAGAAPATADQLAAQMRLLAGNPNDLPALLTAGELSVKLDDLGAAASFFARAEKVDPRSGRAKAGEGSILVHAERPGEALRYFAQAESYGLAPAAFAADRGLAYDLIGEQERAQRDYRLALRNPSATGHDDEAQRRYALSLAIAGKRDLAEQELQPLLRQSDRGAWRARAFVLALGGNVAEAERIATTMMPPGTAAGFQPFLERLPSLGTIDRAFAVHFGEVRSTPERLADARKVPALPVLGPDPYAPRLAVAAVAPDKGKRRGEPKRRGKPAPVQVTVAIPAPEPLPQTPAYRPLAGAPPVLASRGTAPTAWPTTIAPVAPSRPPVALAAPSAPATPPVAVRAPAAVATAPARPTPVAFATAPPAEANVVVGGDVIPRPTPPPVVAMSQPAPLPTPVPAATTSVAVFADSSSAVAPATPRPSPAVVADLPARVAEVPPPPVPADRSALSRIVASLPIPAAELGVAGPATPRSLDATPAADKAAAAKALADKRAADRKAIADRKALAEKKAALAKKAEEAREEAARRKIERANPERIWVQVAGGANQGDLPKAWAAAKVKGGDVFAGHATGWTTPLRFTNRVLAGPFKSDGEARSFVNTAKGAGLSAFTFTSDAGQIVTKLPAQSSGK